MARDVPRHVLARRGVLVLVGLALVGQQGPQRHEGGDAELRRVVLAIRATTGIEALIWLTDVAGLARPDAAALMRSSAHSLLREACRVQASTQTGDTSRRSRGARAGRGGPGRARRDGPAPVRR